MRNGSSRWLGCFRTYRLRFARIEKPNFVPIEDQRAASLSRKTESVGANTESADAPQSTAINKTDTSDAGMVTTAVGTTGSDRSESIIENAVAHSSQKLPAETPSVQMATRSEPDAVHHTDTGDAVRPLEIVDEWLMWHVTGGLVRDGALDCARKVLAEL